MYYKFVYRLLAACRCLLHAACLCSLHADPLQINSVQLINGVTLGVSHHEGRKLRLEDFHDCLYRDSIQLTVNRGFKMNKQRRLCYYEQPKRALNNINLKFVVDDDLITCSPLKRDGKIL